MVNAPDRVLPLQGAPNFRDLGGYRAADGRSVRWRRLFRSGHLGELTSTDLQAIGGLGLTQAFDFRGVEERAAAPYAVPGLSQHSLSIEPSVVQGLRRLVAAGVEPDASQATRLMTKLYRDIINDHSHRLGTLFDHLARTDDALVFHCTAGKDRTGIAAALILLVLGVPKPVVMQDYLLTRERMPHPTTTSTEWPVATQAVLRGVEDAYLEAALDAVEASHGGVEAYVRDRLGLGPAGLAALRQRYLQDS